MNYGAILAALLVLTVLGFYLGRARARAAAGRGQARLHSLPGYYGAHVAIWMALPAFALFVFWISFQGAIVEGIVWNGLPDRVTVLGETKPRDALPAEQRQFLINNIRNYAAGDVVSGDVTALMKQGAAHFLRLEALSSWILAAAMAILAAVGLLLTYRSIAPAMRARVRVERVALLLLMAASTIAILTTVGIVLSLLFEALAFFTKVSPVDFLFGLEWSPQTAIREDQVGASGAFGAIPVFAGTMLITVIAMIVAVPVGLFAAIYLSEYASRRLRAAVKPVLEVLAGIPTVVYGFFAALTVAPMIRDAGAAVGLSVASESALAAGLIMGIMIIPVRQFAVGRHHQRGAPGPARRLLRAGRDPLGNDPPGRAAGGAAGNRRRRAARRLPRHRRDDDRRDGGRPVGKADGQSLRRGDHGDRADRHQPDRRPGIRQPQDPVGIRPRPGAVPGHPVPQRDRPQGGPEIPREI